MSAQKKIEKLTDSWYGYALFSAVMSVLMSGFGILTLVLTGISLAFTLMVTFIIGRNLQKKGRITRLICIVTSAIATIGFSIGSVFGVMAFLSDWSLRGLAQIAMSVTLVLMNGRSFATLTDKQVKAHFQA